MFSCVIQDIEVYFYDICKFLSFLKSALFISSQSRSKFNILEKIREIKCILKLKHIILRALKLFCAPGIFILTEEAEISHLCR